MAVHQPHILQLNHQADQSKLCGNHQGRQKETVKQLPAPEAVFCESKARQRADQYTAGGGNHRDIGTC